MKIGIISDAHGNATALDRCIQLLKASSVDHIYFLGDAVGYLPGGEDVVNILKSTGVNCVKGNHEAMLLGDISLPQEKEMVYQIQFTRKEVSQANLQFIREWPDHRKVTLDGRRILLVHGSPMDYLEGYVYPKTELTIFKIQSCDVVFMGHTHYPFVRLFDGTLIVNVGSCGLPRDCGNLAAFSVYDTCSNQAEINRVEFDSKSLFHRSQSKFIAPEVQECLRRRCPSPYGQKVYGDLL
jgi:putative phosphoesterase